MSSRRILIAALLASFLAATVNAAGKEGVAADDQQWRQPKTRQPSRLWTEAGGKRKATATLLGATAREAKLKKQNGKLVTIALARLDPTDRRYILDAIAANHAHSGKRAKTGGWTQILDGLKSQAELRNDLLKMLLPDAASQTTARPVPANMVYVRFSEPFLRRYVHETVDRHRGVTDNILGTAIYGNARLVGRTQVRLLPDADRANVELRLAGTTYSRTVGYNGPVQIYSQATTPFVSLKRIALDGEGVRSSSTRTAATTRSITTGIGTNLPGLRGCIARRVAWRRVAASRAQADYIAARHTEIRIGREFDRSVAARLVGLTQGIAAELARFAPAIDRAAVALRYSTTEDYMQLVAVRSAGPKRWQAAPPARVASRPEIEVHIHASVVNRAMSDSQWRALLEPVLNVAVDRRILAGQNPGHGAPAWRVEHSEGSQWFTLVLQAATAPQAIARG